MDLEIQRLFLLFVDPFKYMGVAKCSEKHCSYYANTGKCSLFMGCIRKHLCYNLGACKFSQDACRSLGLCNVMIPVLATCVGLQNHVNWADDGSWRMQLSKAGGSVCVPFVKTSQMCFSCRT